MTTPIVTRAPTRIDFGGGWTDVPPYSNEVGGFVCNVAITRYATVSISPSSTGSPDEATSAGDRAIITAAARRFRLQAQDVDISVTSDFPIGAGLGGSSAVGVATCAAFAAMRRQSMSPSAIAELSRENAKGDLGVPGRRPDH